MNAILRDRGDKIYQNIPAPQLHESEVLYIPSDSVTIESNYLRHGKNARVDCKLDAISVSVLCLLDVLKEDDTPQFALDDMSATIDRRYFAKNERKMSYNRTWGDVQRTGKLKNTRKSTEFPEDAIWKAFLEINRCTSCSLVSQSLMLSPQ